jgi:fructose-bisphosphate aldolase, class II
MPLVTLREVLAEAEKGKYAVGAFNTNNMEIVQAIMEAAEEEKAPVILQASQGALKYAGIHYITAIVRAAAKSSTIPIVLHLDHGTSFEQTMLCIKHGFTSVMFDGSKFPWRRISPPRHAWWKLRMPWGFLLKANWVK